MKLTIMSWVGGVLLIVLIWWVVAWFAGDIHYLPPPSHVFGLLGSSAGLFASIGFHTAVLAAAGLLVASMAAGSLVVVIGLCPRLEPLVYPYIVMLKATPAVAFAPLLVVLLHSGPHVKIIVAAMISFFPMVVGGIDGLKRCPERLLLLADAYGTSRLGLFRQILGGYAISGFLSGMKTAAPLSVVGAIVGEFVDASAAGESGIGVYIASNTRYVFMDHVFAGVIVATLTGLLSFGAVYLIWSISERLLHLGK